MPIYEYECKSCANIFEIFQRMAEDPLTICPDCSGPVKKLVSMSSFQLKGGGWYTDGYATKAGNVSDSAAGETPSTNTAEKTEKSKDGVPAAASTTSKESCPAAT